MGKALDLELRKEYELSLLELLECLALAVRLLLSSSNDSSSRLGAASLVTMQRRHNFNQDDCVNSHNRHD